MVSVAELALSNEYKPISTEKYVIPISCTIALDIYSSTKPCNLKIGSLQKGLIFVVHGVERAGEGTGFGFPVVMYGEETYFSGSATVYVKQNCTGTEFRKEFVMNRIVRNQLKHVHLENPQARTFIRVLTDLYQKNRRFRYLALKEIVVNMGVKSAFIETAAIGKIPVTYKINGSHIDVEADFRQLKKRNPNKIFILNEQSATFFPRYQDSNGAEFVGKNVGAWDDVTAESAWLTDLDGQIGYRLWNVDDCVFRRGRETMKKCLDWSGLDYEVYPKKQTLKYSIEIFEGTPQI
jgi:hypothetical protein